MPKKYLRHLSAALALTTVSVSMARAQNPPHLYLLKNPATQQWSSCATESDRERIVEEVTATEVANVEFLGTAPAVARITFEDQPDAGDWASFDTYKLAPDGKALSLIRETNVLPGHTKRIQTYTAEGGRLHLIRTTYRDLYTQARKSGPDDSDFPVLPIYQRLSQMPFAAFVSKPAPATGCHLRPSPNP